MVPVASISRFILAACAIAVAGVAQAQHHGQVHTGVGLTQPSDSFFEQVGMSFNAHGQNWFFQQNAFGGGPAPQFGGAMPGAGAATGFGLQFPGGGGANFGLTAGQGFTGGLNSVATSVTSLNGQTGRFTAVTETPFVMGAVPVVGEAPPAMPWSGSPLQERISRLKEGGAASSGIRAGSRADRALTAQAKAGSPSPASQQTPASAGADRQRSALAGQPSGGASGSAGGGLVPDTIQQSAPASVEELKAMRAAANASAAAAEQREAEKLAARASEAEAAGKTAVARIYYQQAARRATGPSKAEWTARATALSAASHNPSSAAHRPSSASHNPPIAP